MIDYGTAPASDEIEVILFGPGYGESIAVHLGENKWFLIDSCIDPYSKASASGHYLDEICGGSEHICAIVASHWHDDHVRGISKLAAKYPQADFVIAAVFSDKEAIAFLSAFNEGTSSGLGKGTTELFTVLKERENIYYALQRMLVIDDTVNGRPITVTALSPVSAAFSQSIAGFAQYLPKKDTAINNAPKLKLNLESLALHIDFGDDAILLGADLEDHVDFGWTAIAADSWAGNRKPASLYKVAHHGSKTGHSTQVWENLLEPNPKACLTPWVLAGKRIPSDAEAATVKANAQDAYIASGATRTPNMDHRQLKRLKDIAKNVALVDSGFGAVRLRKKIGATSWKVELFGAAQQL